jgi:D-aminopeptidase
MSEAPAPRGPRPRELGVTVGSLPAGPGNAITDVPGVRVGHVTVWRDDAEPPAGRGVARTGVTAIVPGDPATLVREPLPAGAAVLNGAGELTGFLQVSEWGVVETPVYLTATMQVGRVLDGAVAAALAADPAVGVDHVVIPVVGECDDSWLSDARTVHVEAGDAGAALAAAAAGPVAEGAVGAGTGMVALGWKGGIGTASRVLPAAEATLGVLVLANFGTARDLRVDGVPVGKRLGGGVELPRAAGSCIAVVCTDAPLAPAQLERVARRCGLGLARTGSVAHHGSGEIFLALSTGARRPRGEPALRERVELVTDGMLDELFAATVEATEEAVLNALWAAPDVTGRDGRLVRGLPHDDVLALLDGAGRLGPTGGRGA